MNDVKNNYFQILEKIAKVAKTSGRDPQEITLIAVTKNHTWEEILPLYEAGCRHFGENRLPEALTKIENAPQDIHWHFIGSLQKNKARKTAENFTLIHSVDSEELAIKISECKQNTPILLQVNISGEATKHGFSEKSLLECFERLFSLPSLKIEGLMTMAPLTDNKEIIRQTFRGLRLLQEKLNTHVPKNKQLKTLSMGMSHDFELAIEEGATHLRIGSAIFNP
jgi:PLP dependent protein